MDTCKGVSLKQELMLIEVFHFTEMFNPECAHMFVDAVFNTNMFHVCVAPVLVSHACKVHSYHNDHQCFSFCFCYICVQYYSHCVGCLH